MIPLPTKINQNCKPGSPLKNKLKNGKGQELMERLKTVLKESEKPKSKELKKIRKRTDFVLNYQSNESEFDFDPLRQFISLSSEDSYVTFGVKQDAGKQAVAKTTALVLNQDTLKKVESVAPGDNKLEIKPKLGKKATKKLKKLEREKTKGDDWYGMPATEVTEEVKRDLEVLKMRDALDPKRFYKKNATKELPKYFQVKNRFRSRLLIGRGGVDLHERHFLFQIGKYVDSPAEYYTDRTGSKSKNKNLVDELLADAEFKRYNKRKYNEIVEEKSKHMQHKDRKKFVKKQKVK